MEISEFLIRFLGSFLFVIGLLYAVFFYLKRNPAAMSLIKKGSHASEALSVETVLPLEPRKNLYIVRAGDERFLLSTSPEGTQFLSKLEGNGIVAPVSVSEAVEDEDAGSQPSNAMRFTPAVQWLFSAWARLKQIVPSLKALSGVSQPPMS